MNFRHKTDKTSTPRAARRRRGLGLWFSGIERRKKRWVLMAADSIILPFALWGAYVLRFAEVWPARYTEPVIWLFMVLPFLGVAVFYKLGLYRVVIRYIRTGELMLVVFKGVAFLTVLLWSLPYFAQVSLLPRSIPINFALISLTVIVTSRLMIRGYYHWVVKHYADKEAVIIYGAGGAGAQLASSLSGGREFYVVAFLDDDTSLWGSSVLGVNVHPPTDASKLVAQYQAERVLLALPSVTNKERKHALDMLEGVSVHVQTVPALQEIVSGQATLDQIREVDIEDLLGRDPVPPRKELIDISIEGKVVLVTGAGGSIGSELCRQILVCTPKALIMLDLSEFALYSIHQELKQYKQEHKLEVKLYPFLGSVCNRDRVEAILSRYRVQTVYHAAAYKHVPMLEHNVFEGIRNNVIGTLVVAESAAKYGVERCVLVSTDKAVRPTNVMGATKRLSELILQTLSANDDQTTVFSMVRFGNVLGSSGSVVPLFREQIEQGGPVTVTHPDITRYFMTIPEAALLVIQAGSMAEGGDVFVLEMGEPVRIVDLAHRMIELSGLEVRNDTNPFGDIEIVFTGLRPGEKLFEELLIGEDVIGTDHPKIMKAEEESVEEATLYSYIHALEVAESCGDMGQAHSILKKAVNGFSPNSPLVDWLLPKTEQSSKVPKL